MIRSRRESFAGYMARVEKEGKLVHHLCGKTYEKETPWAI